ncbi:hypothetical protein L9W92_05490 [Pelotomaculum terephthalicicum JT]|uniref:hypothetical protein n=1 Tax=Pelotomaculum terephthalicicum TaxID=206393 RepID=UPI001F039C22|nr:hypothetical protein [Pelotomaculum terephthalicicum]MCG9967509.1 hypothetical protein [Pelotomaculum terephthalicicum JT]
MNHRDAIIDAFEKAKQRVRVISPFTQETITKYLVEPMGKGIIGAAYRRIDPNGKYENLCYLVS